MSRKDISVMCKKIYRENIEYSKKEEKREREC